MATLINSEKRICDMNIEIPFELLIGALINSTNIAVLIILDTTTAAENHKITRWNSLRDNNFDENMIIGKTTSIILFLRS